MVRRALLLVAFTGCFHVPEENQACDDSFAIATVAVTDSGGGPVTGLTVQTIRTSDGADLTPTTTGFPSEGEYAVLDDNNLRDLDPGGSQLRITIGGASFVATGIGGGCHIIYDGPRALTLP